MEPEERVEVAEEDDLMLCPMKIEDQWKCVGLRCPWFEPEDIEEGILGMCSLGCLPEIRDGLYSVVEALEGVRKYLKNL